MCDSSIKPVRSPLRRSVRFCYLIYSAIQARSILMSKCRAVTRIPLKRSCSPTSPILSTCCSTKSAALLCKLPHMCTHSFSYLTSQVHDSLVAFLHNESPTPVQCSCTLDYPNSKLANCCCSSSELM